MGGHNAYEWVPLSLSPWVSALNAVTYHRFLRFYPDGTVISFLTTDQ